MFNILPGLVYLLQCVNVVQYVNVTHAIVQNKKSIFFATQVWDFLFCGLSLFKNICILFGGQCAWLLCGASLTVLAFPPEGVGMGGSRVCLVPQLLTIRTFALNLLPIYIFFRV